MFGFCDNCGSEASDCVEAVDYKLFASHVHVPEGTEGVTRVPPPSRAFEHAHRLRVRDGTSACDRFCFPRIRPMAWSKLATTTLSLSFRRVARQCAYEVWAAPSKVAPARSATMMRRATRTWSIYGRCIDACDSREDSSMSPIRHRWMSPSLQNVSSLLTSAACDDASHGVFSSRSAAQSRSRLVSESSRFSSGSGFATTPVRSSFSRGSMLPWIGCAGLAATTASVSSCWAMLSKVEPRIAVGDAPARIRHDEQHAERRAQQLALGAEPDREHLPTWTVYEGLGSASLEQHGGSDANGPPLTSGMYELKTRRHVAGMVPETPQTS